MSEAVRPPGGYGSDSDGVFGMAVAVQLTGIAESSLRLYERRGLLGPARTAGGTRRYSRDDLDRVRRIASLLEAGLNLSGVALVLDLEQVNAVLQARLAEHESSEREGAHREASDVTRRGGLP